MIWREKNGFFTALNRKGTLITWSNLTGKLLYKIKQSEEASKEKCEHYEVYRADANDITYTRDFYNFKDFSLNLLRSSKPITELDANSLGVLAQNLNMEATNFAGMAFEKCSDIFERTEAFDMASSNLNFDVFHFKVMELSTYEDTNDLNECHVRFHFIHRLI